MRPALRHQPADPPVDIEEAAAYWSARRRLDLNDAADEAAFALWRAEPTHAAALAAVEAVLAYTGRLAGDAELEAWRQAARRPLRMAQRRRWLWIGLLLASLGGLFIATKRLTG